MFGLIGSALAQVLVVWNIVKNIPWLMKIVFNFGTVLKIWDNLETVSVNLYKNHRVGSDDVKLALAALREAFDKGLIDLPNVDETEVSKMLYDIENKIISPKVQDEK